MYEYCVMSDLKLQTTPCTRRILKIRHSIGRASDVEYSTEANIGSEIESNLFAHL